MSTSTPLVGEIDSRLSDALGRLQRSERVAGLAVALAYDGTSVLETLGDQFPSLVRDFGVDCLAVHLREGDRHALASAGYWGMEGDAADVIGAGICASVAVTGQRLLLNRERFGCDPRNLLLEKARLAGLASLPLIAGERTYGTLSVGRYYNDVEEQLAHDLVPGATLVAAAIRQEVERRSARRRDEDRAEENARLLLKQRLGTQRVSRAASDQIYAHALDVALELVSAQFVAVDLVAVPGPMRRLASREAGLAMTGDVCVIETLPITSTTGRLLGLMTLQWQRPHALGALERRMLAVLATEIAETYELDQARAEARREDVLIRAVLASTLESIAVVGPDGVLEYLNDYGLHELGMSSYAQIEGMAWLDLWCDDARPAAGAALDQARGGATARFEGQCPGRDGRDRWWDVIIAPMGAVIGRRARLLVMARDITTRRLSEAQSEMRSRELHHRVKNALSTVQAIAFATSQTAHDVVAFRSDFNERLVALGKTHDLLIDGHDAVDLRALIEAEVEPYRRTRDNAVGLTGPTVALVGDTAVSVGMALHELTTNAVKHGALASQEGRVEISWNVERGDQPDARRLRLYWTERDGRPLSSLGAAGFGSKLLDEILPAQLGATLTRSFSVTGMSAVLDLPLPQAKP